MHTIERKIGRRILIVMTMGIFLLLFVSPWLWVGDGKEDVVESRFFNGRENEIFKYPIEGCKKTCDGSCYKIEWVPFGVRVSACSEDSYFVSFWRQKFYIQ